MIRIGPPAPAVQVEKPRRLLFLDRDGTIIEYRSGHVRSESDISFLPGVLSALRWVGSFDISIVITSNQSSISRGLLEADRVVDLHKRILDDISRSGGRVDLSLLCPHQPADGCRCRKPALGMYEEAARELGGMLPSAIVVGDAACDIAAAVAMGARPVLVDTGLGTQTAAKLAVEGMPDRCLLLPSVTALPDFLRDGNL
jgi:D-glycero-D-manno-heptose 1,7-bisphosphate phosphatase